MMPIQSDPDPQDHNTGLIKGSDRTLYLTANIKSLT
jgi:hypothetical protein